MLDAIEKKVAEVLAEQRQRASLGPAPAAASPAAAASASAFWGALDECRAAVRAAEQSPPPATAAAAAVGDAPARSASICLAHLPSLRGTPNAQPGGGSTLRPPARSSSFCLARLPSLKDTPSAQRDAGSSSGGGSTSSSSSPHPAATLLRSVTLPPSRASSGSLPQPQAAPHQQQPGSGPGAGAGRSRFYRSPSMFLPPAGSLPQVGGSTLVSEQKGEADVEALSAGLGGLSITAEDTSPRSGCRTDGPLSCTMPQPPQPSDSSTRAANAPEAAGAAAMAVGDPTDNQQEAVSAEVQELRGSLTARCAAAAQQWKSLDDFHSLRQIGKGAHSICWEAVPRSSSQRDLRVALKAYHVAAMGRGALRRLLLEQRILERHVPHCVRGYGCFEEGGHLFLAMELAGGRSVLQFLDYWRRRKQEDFEEATAGSTTVVPEEDAVSLVLAPLLDALCCLHAAGFVHRDVKPANAVFDAAGRLRLIDFGLALDTASAEVPCCQIGTRQYMAPELLGDRPPSLALVDRTDCWAVGVMAFQLLTGQLPWAHEVPARLYRMLLDDPVPLKQLSAVGASVPACNFICRALQKEPALRPCAEELRAHPWLLQHAGGQAQGGSTFAA